MAEDVPRRQSTLDEVAELAGVSRSVASRVLNNAPHVSPAKREAVERAVHRLGYVPNPTARALSHYFHNVRNNHLRHCQEGLPPFEAMAAEEARLAPVLAAGDYKNEVFRAFTYKARGRYLEQLARYLDRFPRENLLVLRAEDLFEDPAGLMGRLADFLGIDRARGRTDFKAMNVGRNREPVEPGVREALDAYFAPHNRALAAALGRDFGW